MINLKNFREYFRNVKTEVEHNPYYCSVERVLLIVILGSICGLDSVKKIHRWASNEKTKRFLSEHFGILTVPSYAQLVAILGIIEPKSLNECFMNWVASLLPETLKDLVVSMDGKTIRSTGKMSNCSETVHIVSAHVASLGITIGQVSADAKSNEIPAFRDLIKLLDIEGCIVVADALNCQKKTCAEIIGAGADYLLEAKGNQKALMDSIEEHIFGDDVNPEEMDYAETQETNKGRLEVRRAIMSNNVDGIANKDEWPSLSSIGAINRQAIRNGTISNEWHFYFSSRQLSALELLNYARSEWSVETMHWLLDVHLREDFCRIEDENAQKNMNMLRKVALNILTDYKKSLNLKSAISNLMLDCLVDSSMLLKITGF